MNQNVNIKMSGYLCMHGLSRERKECLFPYFKKNRNQREIKITLSWDENGTLCRKL